MERLEKVQVEISVPQPEDARGVQTVLYRTWLDTYPNEKNGISVADIKESFASRLTEEGLAKMAEQIAHPKPNTLFLVAKSLNEVIGVCRLKKDDHQNELQAIYVLPEYQGKGIGVNLWQEAQKFFDLDKDIVVRVADYNDKAINFYKKLGFIDTGKRLVVESHTFKSGAVIPEMEMIIKAKK